MILSIAPGPARLKLTLADLNATLKAKFPQKKFEFLLKSRFPKNPHMAIFRCENAAKWILFFRNLHEKLGKKMLWEIFFWSNLGQRWTHLKIDHFPKNGPKSSILKNLTKYKPF
jgi:hypothetical protein